MRGDSNYLGIKVEGIGNIAIQELLAANATINSLVYIYAKTLAGVIPSMYMAFADGLVSGSSAPDGDKLQALANKHWDQIPAQMKKEWYETYTNNYIKMQKIVEGGKDIARILSSFPGLANNEAIFGMLAKQELLEHNQEFLNQLIGFEAAHYSIINFANSKLYSLCRMVGEKLHDQIAKTGALKSEHVNAVLELYLNQSIACAALGKEFATVSTKPLFYATMAQAAFCGGLVQGWTKSSPAEESRNPSLFKETKELYNGTLAYFDKIEQELIKEDKILNRAKATPMVPLVSAQTEKAILATLNKLPASVEQGLIKARTALWTADGMVASATFKAGSIVGSFLAHSVEAAKSIFTTQNKRHNRNLPPRIIKEIIAKQAATNAKQTASRVKQVASRTGQTANRTKHITNKKHTTTNKGRG